MTWRPTDAELDAEARLLPVADRAADRVEQERTSLLAQAAATTQRRRSSLAPRVAAGAALAAAAAAIVIWIVVRPGAGPKEQITALGVAHYERVTPWPDFVVRVDDGRVAIRVAKLASAERFRAVTTDAEIEVRGTQLTVAAVQGHVAAVAVGEGRVEVRYRGEPPVFLGAGETWSPPRTAQVEEVTPSAPGESIAPPHAAPEQGSPAPVVSSTPSTDTGTSLKAASGRPTSPAAKTSSPTKAAPARASSVTTTSSAKTGSSATSASAASTTPATTAPETTAPATPAPPAAVSTPRPGEAEFRAGVAALRAGDPSAATRSFAAACTAARGEALDEDACFWVGAAAKRAGDTATARDALTRFTAAFPASARAGEASALLGWILYDAGDLDAAKARFEAAARDRVAKVKQSAQRGLEAIKRRAAGATP